jgi:hypothetical protein
LSLTGRADGEGGMPRVSRGVRLPLLLRPPGMGGRSSGTVDDIVVSWCAADVRDRCCLLLQYRHKQELDVLCSNEDPIWFVKEK